VAVGCLGLVSVACAQREQRTNRRTCDEVTRSNRLALRRRHDSLLESQRTSDGGRREESEQARKRNETHVDEYRMYGGDGGYEDKRLFNVQVGCAGERERWPGEAMGIRIRVLIEFGADPTSHDTSFRFGTPIILARFFPAHARTLS
jgi:hypothetical protein